MAQLDGTKVINNYNIKIQLSVDNIGIKALYQPQQSQ